MSRGVAVVLLSGGMDSATTLAMAVQDGFEVHALTVAYGHCTVAYTTHAINGLSDNDFICAARIDRLVEADPS